MGGSKISKQHQEILDTAKKRFKLAEDAEQEMRVLALEDQRFRVGEQWDEKDKRQRSLDGRPCLTVNKIPQFVRQVTNDQRQNRPAINVSPVDDYADPDTAKILKGMIRHIEYSSNADIAYDTAFEGAVEHGFGYFRILTEYESVNSFKQKIVIKQIKDSFKVFCDPYFQEPDGSDMNWCMIVEDYSKADYESEFKDTKLSNTKDWESLGTSMPDWVDEDSCRVVEYYYKEYEEKTLCLIGIVDAETGQARQESVYLDELPDDFLEENIIQKRSVKVPVIKWCKLNGVEVLEQTVWPGKYIPIIPVLGDDLIVDGKRHREGIIRHAKDSQKMFNYWVTCETETIALAPKSPWIMAEGQDEGFEELWATANTRPHSSLQYKPVTIGGQLAPPPKRNVHEAPVTSITNARMQASDDMKATTGIYDASLGARSNENSGIAIQRRNQQAQTSNFHFVDNLSRSISHAGRIIVDAIPIVYDVPQAIRILGEGDDQKIVQINQYFEEKGEQKIYDLGVGEYDVTVSNGPSYQTKRQEAAESMLGFIQAYPNAAPLIGDLMAKNMDWPGAQEISERLKKTLPPELQGLDEGGEQKEIPPQVQQQIEQMNQMIEQLTNELNLATEDRASKAKELESKERIEYAKLETDLRKEIIRAEAKLGSLESKASTVEEMAQLQAQQDRLEYHTQEYGLNEGAGPDESVMPEEIIEQQPMSTGGPLPGNFVEE